jgi:hypothetical protein
MNLCNKWTVILLTSFLLSGCWDKGSGEKIGQITRLQRTGFFCQTWEGEIIRGGLNTGSGVVGQAFHFTVEDDALASQVQKAMDSFQEVKITYRAEAISFCRSDSNSHFLTKIEAIGNVTTPPVQTNEVTGVAPPKQPDVLTEILKQNQQMLNTQQGMLEEMRRQRQDQGDGGSGKR